MPNLADFFSPDAFSLISATAAIETFPNQYGRIGALGLFTPEPINTDTAVIEFRENTLNLLPTKQWDAPPTYGTVGKRYVRTFRIPHIPHDDRVYAKDVAGIRAFGSENTFETVNDVYARKLQAMRNKHAITLEHLRATALQGIPKDADGTQLYNYFTEFDITQKTINFLLTTTTTEVISKITELKRYFEVNLKGETMTRVHVLCSTGFFDSLVTHANVKEAYKFYASAQQPLRDDLRMGFVFGGVMFEEYIGSASDIDGNERLFIPTNEAIAVPLGTGNVFRTIFAPAMTYAETVNTMGRELYARGDIDRMGRWIDILTESNPLPIVKRPDLIVKLTRA
jgi:hypothetical protein